MSKPSRILLVLLSLSFIAAIGYADEAQPWGSIDKVFGLTGKVLPGGVHKYSWPRTDLKVMVGGVQVEAGLALGSWSGFIQAGSAGHVMAMGDLMLLSSEVNPVIRALQDGGVEVIALHNHLLGESPQIMALHFSGHGDPEKVARALKSALEKTATPAPKSAPGATPTLTTAEAAAFD